MLAVLKSIDFDPAGYVAFEPDLTATTDGEFTRRVNKVKLLAGGVSIGDRGFHHGDRTLQVQITTPSLELEQSIARLFQTYARLHYSNREGTFLVAPTNFRPSPSELRFTLEVQQKVSA